MSENSQQELYHYGVIGMKWGVRKAARKETKGLRKERNAAHRELKRAQERYGHVWFGKNRRKAAKDRLDTATAAYKKANSEYKAAYKDAKKKVFNKVIKDEGYDKATANRIAKTAGGKVVAQTVLLGSYGAMKYNEARAKGSGRGAAYAKAVLRTYGNNLSLGQMARREQLNGMVDNFAKKK